MRGCCWLVCALLSANVLAEEVALQYQPERIQVRGATVVSEQAIDAVVERYRGRSLDFTALQRLRLQLTDLYRQAGYVNSRVVIPDQDLGAELELHAEEGRLGSVVVVGDTAFRSGFLEQRVQRSVQGPLNIADLQETLELLQRDPLVERLDAEILPGARPDQAVLRLDVDDAPRFSVGIAANNHRSPSLGSFGAQAFAVARNLSGLGDTLLASAGVSDGTDTFALRYATPLTSSGLELEAYYTRSDAQIVEQRFEALDIESDTDTVGLRLSVPLVSTLASTLKLSLALENRTSESSLAGLPFSFTPGARDGKAETATAELSARWDRYGDGYAVALVAGYRRGFHALGASRAKNRKGALDGLNASGADGRFGRWLAQGTVALSLQKISSAMPTHAQLLLRTNWQLSDDPLLSLEKLAMGGAATVRGYRENRFVRDNGGMVSVALHLPIPGYRQDAHWRNLLVVPFLDMGLTWDDRNTNPGAGDTSAKRRFASAGLGLLWQPLRGLKAEVFWGEPISDNFDRSTRERIGAEYDLQDDGIHAALAYTWRF